MTKFKDHFSSHAQAYSTYRPSYPQALYEALAGICEGHDLAWDCATGNGQAALGLAAYFNQVIATDASKKQIDSAAGRRNISYRVAGAENSGLERASVDLITVAQALHWFNHEAFFEEARRVLKPGGILAVWTYNLLEVNEEITALIRRLSEEIVGSYWPPERKYVLDNYRTIKFPFEAAELPAFNMTALWSLDELLGYLATWSSVVYYKADKGHDPLDEILPALSRAWGGADKKAINWPLTMHLLRRPG